MAGEAFDSAQGYERDLTSNLDILQILSLNRGTIYLNISVV